jgi:septum formation protein
MRELILASTSAYRRQLLAAAGIQVRCEAPEVDERAAEDAIRAEDPVVLARELARIKAIAVARRHPQALVIGADQVGYDPDEPGVRFGKPLDAVDHLDRLRSLVGRRHVLVTGLALIGGGHEIVEHETTEMVVRSDVEDAELAAYVATAEGAGCAGGYAVEGRGIFLFERIEGDWTNVIGLPIPRLIGLLRACGWRFSTTPLAGG